MHVKQSLPVLKELKKWMKEQLPYMLPKSSIDQAITYTLGLRNAGQLKGQSFKVQPGTRNTELSFYLKRAGSVDLALFLKATTKACG